MTSRAVSLFAESGSNWYEDRALRVLSVCRTFFEEQFALVPPIPKELSGRSSWQLIGFPRTELCVDAERSVGKVNMRVALNKME